MGRNAVIFLVLVLVLCAAAFASLFYGGSDSLRVFSFETADRVFWEIRFPKTMSAIVAGCALSVAGLVLQVLFRNPLAGPYVLGISSGASLAVAITIITGNTVFFLHGGIPGKSALALSAVTGSFLVTLLILAVSARIRSNILLLLVGLMLGQIFGALQTGLEYFADPAGLKNFVIWGMGSLANTTVEDLALLGPVTLVLLIGGLLLLKPLNALLLGEDYARNAGIDARKVRFMLVLFSSLLAGLTTAYCGPIAFIGIAVPVLSRKLFATSAQHIQYFSCMLIGSIILLLADTACHNLIRNTVLPINMLTTLLGAPVVIWLMFKSRQW